MRVKSKDVLKLLCAFLVICIHIPFKFLGSEYFLVITRIAVPVFFLISGYFYKKENAGNQIKKISILLLFGIVIYTV